jgi:uncharacterized protein YyaL (SSP411 family)
MTNRLSHETSPYLLQHAENPVDWYTWGEEALQKAKIEDKPIFLSIGYSACHWCHVMAHESFEDEHVAAILNKHFINIKVDREERPDLDRIYMNAVQMLTGSGGWPMSVFLTPDGRPFFGGTYFPPSPRFGQPAFTDVLLALIDAWESRRQEIVESSNRLTTAIELQSEIGTGQVSALDPATAASAYKKFLRDFDHENGGWGNGPKFPHPMILEFLLRYYHATSDSQALHMVTKTLEAMARGGIYDQLGGGFHRYSVDALWFVPHFEKMLYDNALLARVYLHAWQVTRQTLFRTITEEILDYIIREMTDPGGGFYSTQDADSEGEEGKFFLWTPTEIRGFLGENAEVFIAAYGVTEEGNTAEDKAHGFGVGNILKLVGGLNERAQLTEARIKLRDARSRREHPGRDEKILASWNGLMLATFSEAARVLNREDYLHVAERNADFLLTEFQKSNHRLQRSWKAGEAKHNAYLEDYTNLIEGLVELYQTTFHSRWFLAARDLTEEMIRHFGASDGGFFDTSDDHEQLITRPRDMQDNAIPSGNAMAVSVLLRLSGLASESRYTELAHRSLSLMQPLLAQHPLAFAQWLIALDYALAPVREVAIVGDLKADDTRTLIDAGSKGYRPYQVVAMGSPGEEAPDVPLLRDRAQIEGRATAYVCVDSTCSLPVTQPEELERLL